MKKFDEILRKGWLIVGLLVIVFGSAAIDGFNTDGHFYYAGLYASFALGAIIGYVVVKTLVLSIVRFFKNL